MSAVEQAAPAIPDELLPYLRTAAAIDISYACDALDTDFEGPETAEQWQRFDTARANVADALSRLAALDGERPSDPLSVSDLLKLTIRARMELDARIRNAADDANKTTSPFEETVPFERVAKWATAGQALDDLVAQLDAGREG